MRHFICCFRAIGLFLHGCSTKAIVPEGGEPCLTAGERSVTRGYAERINRPRRGRTRAARQRAAADSPLSTVRRQPTASMIYSAEWVLFAPFGDD